MSNPAEVGFVLWLILGPSVAFGIWIYTIEKRIQNLANQQKEYWLRHMKNHPNK